MTDDVGIAPEAFGAILGAFDLLRSLNVRTNSIVHYHVRALRAGALEEALTVALAGRPRESAMSVDWAISIGDQLTNEAWFERLAAWVGFTGDLELADEPDPEDLWIGQNAALTQRLTEDVRRLIAHAVGASEPVVRPVRIKGTGGARLWAIHGEAFLVEGEAGRILVDCGWSD